MLLGSLRANTRGGWFVAFESVSRLRAWRTCTIFPTSQDDLLLGLARPTTLSRNSRIMDASGAWGDKQQTNWSRMAVFAPRVFLPPHRTIRYLIIRGSCGSRPSLLSRLCEQQVFCPSCSTDSHRPSPRPAGDYKSGKWSASSLSMPETPNDPHGYLDTQSRLYLSAPLLWFSGVASQEGRAVSCLVCHWQRQCISMQTDTGQTPTWPIVGKPR